LIWQRQPAVITPMIIANEAALTRAVLSEVERTADPRLRRVLSLAVQHLHAFVREAELTEPEFRNICALIAQAGQRTTASHNEVVLAAGSLGVSALVCLLNNAGSAGHPTTANLMGPFWRKGSPETPNGGSIVRSPTPGEPCSSRRWWKTSKAGPWPMPRWTCGRRPARAITKTRTRRRPT
jgi:hydroxyquinol 1,2-dioxygenase